MSEIHESSLDAIAAKEIDELRVRIAEYADKVSNIFVKFKFWAQLRVSNEVTLGYCRGKSIKGN